MSHQTGISVSDELRDAFGNASRSGGSRLIVARIEDEKIVVSDTRAPAGEWHDDLDIVPTVLTDVDAAYVLFRKDDNRWVLMAHVPDKCKVKDKMVYAATRATLKNELGSMSFQDEIHGTLPSDFGAKGYDAWKMMKDADVPLTHGEQRRQEELEDGDLYTGGSSTYVHGVAFPAAAGVKEALAGLVSGAHNYVGIGVDTKAETITLIGTKTLEVDAVGKEVPLDEPRFHFYRYVRDVRGTNYDEIFQIFTCPDGSNGTQSTSIKSRMLYSSSKARVAQLLEEQGGTITKSFEFNEASDISGADIDNATHPAPAVKAAAFVRPKRPGSGNRKLIRGGRTE